MKVKPKYVPLEGEEQATLFNWCAMNYGKHPELSLLFHIPNGGKRSKSEAARFKPEGVKSGVPDLCLPVARGLYHGLYIEMKRTAGGVVSDEQKFWIAQLREQGYEAVVCRGWKAAAEVLENYLNLSK